MNRQPYIPNNYQNQGSSGSQGQGGGRFDDIKGLVNKIRNPKQNFDDAYNLTLASTEQNKNYGFTPGQQSFHTTQPANQQQYYPGKQHEINRHKQNELSKSKVNQYLKNRTDVVTIQGNTNVKAEDFIYDDDQYAQFTFPDPYIKYKIIPAEQYKMALDVTTLDSDKKHLKKGNIIIWDYHGGPNQHFYFQRTRNPNQYFIINASTGFVVEVPNHSKKDNEAVHMTPRFNEQNQLWTLQNVGKDLFIIKSFCGKVLDVQNQWMRNGVPVVQYTQNGGKNQKWMIWPS